jgi:hypothetical protein
LFNQANLNKDGSVSQGGVNQASGQFQQQQQQQQQQAQ